MMLLLLLTYDCTVFFCILATPMADHTLSSMRPPSLSASDHRPLSPVFVGEPLIKIEFTQAKAETAEDPTTKNLDVVFNTLDLVGTSLPGSIYITA